jgi:hypothetical protein
MLGRGVFRYGQMNPPTIPVDKLFPNGGYPVGEEFEYKGE